MRSKEAFVAEQSDYYTFQPSITAAQLYLYPLLAGYFIYEPGYHLKRNNYNNYLLMYIEKGNGFLRYLEKDYRIHEGQTILLDCHSFHEYGNLSNRNMMVPWLHFDGPMAKRYYEVITSASGNVITLSNAYEITHNLRKIIDLFRTGAPIRESAVSIRITRMLSALVNAHPELKGISSRSEVIEGSMAYINEHFQEPVTLEQIAAQANLSPYYFTRIFSEETGFTPHQYLIATRINYARYLLLNSSLSVKKIAFSSGFSSESNFCYTFRKREGITPGEYRISSSPDRSGSSDDCDHIPEPD